MDESYRLARELLSDSFNLNFDPLSPRTGVVPSIAAFCKTGVEVALYKINSYTTGKSYHLEVSIVAKLVVQVASSRLIQILPKALTTLARSSSACPHRTLVGSFSSARTMIQSR